MTAATRAAEIDLRRREALVLTLACLGMFVVVLDATIVSVALPDVRAAVGFSSESLPWVVNAYTLAFAGFLLLGGRCCDVFGVRRVLLLGMSVFTIARVLGGAGSTPELLLAARAAQGLGGTMLMPATLALLTTTFTEPGQRTRALATWSAVGAVGAASGPLIGGLLTEWLSWRWVFFVSVPIGVVAIVMALRVLPRHRPVAAGRIDVVGAVLATSGLVAVVLAVMESSGSRAITVFGPLAAGVALLAVFLAHQAWWATQPLLPLQVFRLRPIASGNLVMLLHGFGFFASPILLSLYLQDVMGYSPMRAGWATCPSAWRCSSAPGQPDRSPCGEGPRRATVVCTLCGAAGFFGCGTMLGANVPYVFAVGLPGLVFGLGSAAAFTPITVGATSGVPSAEQGLAAGLLNTTRQISGAIGLAVLSAVAATISASSDHGGDRAALANGYATAFLISGACLIVAAIAAMITMPRDHSEYGWGQQPTPPRKRTGSYQRPSKG